MSNFSIPQSMNPVRYQASLGGNVKSTNINNVHEQFQIELGIVKKVFYRKGTLLFSIINRGSSVSVVGNDTSSATASAPIPVETFGRNSDGKVFGGYRPVKVGSKIAVGYVNGERSAPIVLGVYPDNDESYEIVSPVSFETGEDSDKSVEDIALGSKEITASQNIIYQSGKGDILKTFNGKSLLYINANGSNYMDDINYAYDQIADTRDGNMNPVTPRETRAQSWLLVHEDNPENEETNGHRTRFYVNKNGEFQMVMFSPNNDGDNNLVVFTASKDDGFKLRKQFDTDDLDGSEEYVQFSIGSGNSAVLQSVDKDNASEISMLPNGLQLTTPNNGAMTFNGRSLETMFGSISSAVDAAKAAGDTATIAASAGAIAQSAASDAASQALAASQAGEDAKIAAVDAQAAGEDAKAQAKDTRDRIIYYASISKEKDVAVPGKYIIVNTDTYIANGTIKTAHIGDAAITNAKIADLAVGTAQLEDAAITRAKIGNLAVGTAQIEDAAITDAKVGNLSADHLNAGTIDFSVISGIHINASEIDVGKLVANQLEIRSLDELSNNLGTIDNGTLGNLNNWGSVKIYADVYAHTFSNLTGTFTADANGGVVASNLTIRGVTNLVYNASLLGGSGSNIPGWNVWNNGYCALNIIHDGVPSIGWNNTTGAGVWTVFALSKKYPLNGATGQPFSASVWFIDFGSDTSLQYNFTLAFYDSNGNRIDGAYVSQGWNGIGSGQGWRYVTINNAVAPSNAVSVGLQYWAHNGKGTAAFSSPMLTQSSHSTGYQPDTGNVVSAGEIDGSVINGSTINGATINAGSINTNGNNTARLYPFTADSNGVLRSYTVSDHFASYARMYSGNIVISDRNMDANSGSNNYGGETAVIGGSSISLSSGYTVGKDTDFTKPLVSEGQPGTTQLILSGINGITLKGDDQKIHFHGMYSDSQPKGITFTPYGNINGDEGNTTGNWYVGYNLSNMTAQFGIDNFSKNTINFYRPLFVNEVGGLTGNLLIHNSDGKSQMLFWHDSDGIGVNSATIYNRTYSSGSTVTITSNGVLGRITSATKYKLNIGHYSDTEKADRLFSLDPAFWHDKFAVEKIAERKSEGETPKDGALTLNYHYGLIAEDLVKAGLEDFVIKNYDGEVEGIAYDRLWTVLIPKIRDLSNNQINDRMTISRLEKEVERLKQEVKSK